MHTKQFAIWLRHDPGRTLSRHLARTAAKQSNGHSRLHIKVYWDIARLAHDIRQGRITGIASFGATKKRDCIESEIRSWLGSHGHKENTTLPPCFNFNVFESNLLIQAASPTA